MSNDTQVDHHLCHANYCPLIGTSTRSTTSADKHWLCFIHFSAEEADWPAISSELNRLGWISEIVKRLRAGANLTAEQHQQFTLCQRTDLRKKDHENARAWMIRLEGVLEQSCKDAMVQP